MIEKKTIIDQIEVTRDGSIQIRFGLQVIEDGIEIGCNWHRVCIPPGGDIDAAIAAVNADITTRESIRAKQIDNERIPLVKSICSLVHTPEVIEVFRAKRAAEEQKFSASMSTPLESISKK